MSTICLALPHHAVRYARPRELDERDHDDYRDDGGNHDVGAEAQVPVLDGKVAQTAAAERSRHRGAADKVYDGERQPRHDGRKRLRHENLPYYLPVRRTHGAGSLHHSLGNLVERRFGDAGDERCRRERQRDYRRRGSDDGFEDEPRERKHHNHEDYERERAENVYDAAQNHVQHGMRRYSALGSRVEQDAEREPDYYGEYRGEENHRERLQRRCSHEYENLFHFSLTSETARAFFLHEDPVVVQPRDDGINLAVASGDVRLHVADLAVYEPVDSCREDVERDAEFPRRLAQDGRFRR